MPVPSFFPNFNRYFVTYAGKSCGNEGIEVLKKVFFCAIGIGHDTSYNNVFSEPIHCETNTFYKMIIYGTE